MNIFQITKGSAEFTEDQRAVLMDVLHKYSLTDDGKWLNEVDYTSMVYKWSPVMEDSYVMAACPLIGSTIYSMPKGKSPDYWVVLVSPAIVHELYHKWQIRQNPVKYLCCSILSRLFMCFSEDLYMTTRKER